MTGKRYRKLLMARGVGRDKAALLLWAARVCGISNEEAWESYKQVEAERDGEASGDPSGAARRAPFRGAKEEERHEV